jgi:lipid-binding SYLF domain-containing protein
MHAEILTYSRSRGIFAGVSLNGAVVEPDRSGDHALYGNNVDREAVVSGEVPVPRVADGLVAEITRYTAQAKGWLEWKADLDPLWSHRDRQGRL